MKIVKVMLCIAIALAAFLSSPKSLAHQDIIIEDQDNIMAANPINVEIAYEDWLKNQPKPKKVLTSSSYHPGNYNVCSCVSYARYLTGIDTGSIGLAKNHPINSQTASIGAIVVLRSGWTGHLAVVTAIDGNYIHISEANYIKCKITTNRVISLNDASIRGYYH